MNALRPLSGIPLILLSAELAAAPATGIYFSHLDWELACDNTRTCRAAGYHVDDQFDAPVSVLLTRKAGAGQSVTGEINLGMNQSEVPKTTAQPAKFTMRINGEDLGEVQLSSEQNTGSLSAKQVNALLAALKRDSKIEWFAGDDHRFLSDKGAAAVLLKMDEFQGRIGSQTALMKPGKADEQKLLPALPLPEIVVPVLSKTQPADQALAKSKAVLEALKASLKGKDDPCPLLSEAASQPELTIQRLTNSQLLVSTTCWNAAYNQGDGYWLINQSAPFHAVLVTESASEYQNGVISAMQKSRGIGDCLSQEAWAWDGKQFQPSESLTTGMCKGFMGGAWSLPTIATRVRNLNEAGH